MNGKVMLSEEMEKKIKGTVLEKILKAKIKRINERLHDKPCKCLKEEALSKKAPACSFSSAINQPGKLSIIGEIKKASPSKGIIQHDFDPVGQSLAYERGGVKAVSVLTEEDFFLGCDAYLSAISEAVNIPVLRKDFIVHESQIYEARLLGASAVLLIVAMLDDERLRFLLNEAKEMGLEVLVEIHNEDELLSAVEAGAKIIGINNRNLKTFEVDIATTERLAPKVPKGIVVVAESGIHTGDDMLKIYEAGVNGVLIGESLMKAAGSYQSVKAKIDELMSRVEAKMIQQAKRKKCGHEEVLNDQSQDLRLDSFAGHTDCQ